MRVWHKVVVAPGTAILFLVAFGAVSYAMMSRQHAVLGDLYNGNFESYQRVAKATQAVGEVHSSVYRLFTWLGNLKEEQVTKISNEQKARIDGIAKDVAQFAAEPRLGERERTIGEAVVKKLAKYKSDVDTAIALSSVDPSTGMSMMQAADSGFQAMLNDFNELVQIEKELAQAGYEGARKTYDELVLALAAILAAALVISAVLTFFMSRAIVRPIRSAIAAAARISSGDLSVELSVKGRDETAELLRALQNMSASLRKIVLDVRAGTDAISTASKEMAAGNADLSHRTEEQAGSLEETASSMEELTSTVKQSAQNSRQANELAAGASQVAVKGGEAVGQVVSTMHGISESSKKIADIIGVIDGIAFQTNILALNAAVEAARAGEQGRGFAVVATEVRTLAQRSAAAAKEIKGLIADSVGKVDEGTRQVGEAGKTMEEIVASVRRVSDIMSEITAATQEQSSGIEQVNQAVMQMDQMTQQNAALVEEAAAAAESMQQQAQELGQVVALFRLTDDAHAQPQAPQPDAPVKPAPLIERRAAARPKNVARLPAKAVPQPQARALPPAKTGTDDDWSEF